MLNYLKSMMIITALLLTNLNVYASPSTKSIHLLRIINQWNDYLGKELLLHDMKFSKSFVEFKNTKQWFHIDQNPEEKDTFYQFASSADGSNYYLWFYPELIGEPPVVGIDVSDDSADSVTENLEDFICSLIQGNNLEGGSVYNTKSDQFSKVEKYKQKILKNLNCPEKIKVYFGLKKHPKFDEWLDKLDSKYQK